jgi:hypothetical protein
MAPLRARLAVASTHLPCCMHPLALLHAAACSYMPPWHHAHLAAQHALHRHQDGESVQQCCQSCSPHTREPRCMHLPCAHTTTPPGASCCTDKHCSSISACQHHQPSRQLLLKHTSRGSPAPCQGLRGTACIPALCRSTTLDSLPPFLPQPRLPARGQRLKADLMAHQLPAARPCDQPCAAVVSSCVAGPQAGHARHPSHSRARHGSMSGLGPAPGKPPAGQCHGRSACTPPTAWQLAQLELIPCPPILLELLVARQTAQREVPRACSL